ncbi:hypothetical protein Tco_0846190, partial [Tanacetum coccineum]
WQGAITAVECVVLLFYGLQNHPEIIGILNNAYAYFKYFGHVVADVNKNSKNTAFDFLRVWSSDWRSGGASLLRLQPLPVTVWANHCNDVSIKCTPSLIGDFIRSLLNCNLTQAIHLKVGKRKMAGEFDTVMDSRCNRQGIDLPVIHVLAANANPIHTAAQESAPIPGAHLMTRAYVIGVASNIMQDDTPSFARHSFDLPGSSNIRGDDTTITIETEQKMPTVVAAQPTGRPWEAMEVENIELMQLELLRVKSLVQLL